ncbi:MAG: thiamine-phosphate kinase [Planctomycetota bacterium]
MEADFLDWLRRRLPPDKRTPLGLSSDAAFIPLNRPPGSGTQASGTQGSDTAGLIATTDALTDGVDFLLGQDDPRRIGRKALAVNLSDLAAAAARPLAVLVSLVLPRMGAAELAREIFEGLLPLAEQFQVAIAGGDTNTWDGSLVINITALGEPVVASGWSRTGAQPGDVILVTGDFGGSRLGKQFDFTPRVSEALRIAQRYAIHAATDVSDGLSLDLEHVMQASGCGAVIDEAAIPVAAAAHEYARQQADGRRALEHALSDGEDFELILVAAPAVAQQLLADQSLGVPVTRIGECVAQRGLWCREKQVSSPHDAAGEQLRPMVPRGWEHGSHDPGQR